MAFFSKLSKAFGFDNEGVDNDPLIADDPETADYTLPKSAGGQKKQTRQAAAPAIVPRDDSAMQTRIFNYVLETFNKALPDFLQRSIDPEAQRRALFEGMQADMRKYVTDIADDARRRCSEEWTRDRQKLQDKVNDLESRAKDIEAKRNEIEQKKLSSDRQRRALTDRAHDLEKQVAQLEAEREQYQLESRSLQNKLKVLSVSETEAQELHEENMRLMAENTRLRNGMGGTQTVTETVKVPDPEVVKELEEARAEIARLRKEIESKADTSAQSAETAKALSDKDAQIKRLNEEVSKLRAAASTGIEPEALRELEKQIERFEVIRRKKDARINDLQHRQKELVASEKSLKEEIAALKSRLDGGDVTDLSVSESESFSSSRRRTVRHDAPIDDILSDTDWLVPSSSLKSSKNTDPEGSRRSRRERAKDQNKDQSKDNESGQMRLF